ncbi:hypothetical protein ZWY2020_047602 [Hordeum vulgare]|nr:hypothetical protein ZWY2020_047602 [Hordeum vulgare]
MLIDPAKANKALPPIWSEVLRFFTDPHKPTILALSRPDPKKNITTLLKAYGERRQLRELANLTLILENRDDIDERRKWILLHVAHESDMLNSQGVFINPALVEPFGLTIIEITPNTGDMRHWSGRVVYARETLKLWNSNRTAPTSFRTDFLLNIVPGQNGAGEVPYDDSSRPRRSRRRRLHPVRRAPPSTKI